MNPRIDLADSNDLATMNRCIKNMNHDMVIRTNDFTCNTCGYRIIETINNTCIIVRFTK